MNERDQMEAEEREERIRDAAPDMLAALQAVVRGFETGNLIEPIEQARAAIAKAEGRDQ